MRAPTFWWEAHPTLGARLLSPLAALYGFVSARRMWENGARATIPVICIGNPTTGGAGKTPTALYVAERLKQAGHSPVFLTRGYGGSLKGPVLVDLLHHDAADCGDEPLLLAQSCPTVVAADRALGAGLAAQNGDVIVMDDGFQNPSLQKDLTIAVIDGAVGVGNGLVLPAGPLRAPLSAQWPRVDAVIVIGGGEPGRQAARQSGRPVLSGRLEPTAEAASALRDQRVLGFAGIGRPEKFFATLDEVGARLVVRRSFPDHHRYTRAEIAALIDEGRTNKAVPVTTEKDIVKIMEIAPDLAPAITVVPVALTLEDPSALDALIEPLFRRSTHQG